jgi:hypothetical protein
VRNVITVKEGRLENAMNFALIKDGAEVPRSIDSLDIDAVAVLTLVG